VDDILARVRSGEVLLADGATGTLAIERGWADPACPEAMNLSHPERCEQIAREYREAGAQVLQTNTFGASPLALEGTGFADRVVEINRAAVLAARRSAAGAAFVAGSCGPSRLRAAPNLKPGDEELRASYRVHLAALLEAGADAIAIETMIDLEEAILAVETARSLSSSVPIFAMMVFVIESGEPRTLSRDTADACARRLSEAGADLLGANCGAGVRALAPAVQALRAAGAGPLVFRPSAGLPEVRAGRRLYPDRPEPFAERTAPLAQEGVSILGGCCGTTPEHIRSLAQKLRRSKT
jgi:methionine synthase I (cobalamin-dependent)